MPADASHITLLLPGLRAALSHAALPPSLARLAARGSGFKQSDEYASRAALQWWQRDVLRELGLDANRFASAPLCALARGQSSGAWLHVEPVHLAVSMDGLALQTVRTRDTAELNALEPALRAHCEQAGFEWHRLDNDVLLHCRDALQVTTVAPQSAALHGLRGAQPEGADAKRLIQLSTELQMLLHEHPSQRARLARGEPPINALWLWGAGEITTERATLPIAWSDSPYLRGLYRACGAECHSLSEWPAAANASQSNAILVANVSDAADAEQRWFALLYNALQRGVWRSARIYLDDMRFDVSRSQLWRIWRRDLSLEDFRI